MRLGNKKLGRPTDNPKDISLKIRLDNDTSHMLEECSEALKLSKAEVVRQGIHKMHSGLNKK
ncbi:CopG family transcriptional regulator [Ligaoa zhengdingensis]|uniref:CopG family transcriptional regulator n=1 Tax=Ligaoa zhengdingensis TaxID=2763658 RepID=UPI00201601F4|nr:CopG family transcriptional regulator [Ligaoa zhengdingensis]